MMDLSDLSEGLEVVCFALRRHWGHSGQCWDLRKGWE